MSRPGQRLDKWLWFARLAKTRSLAGRLIGAGKVRINRARVTKASRIVRPGDIITATVQGRVRVLKVLDEGRRRGPAAEARALYEDLSPPPAATRPPLAEQPPARRPEGAGRPTKRARRRIDAWTARARAGHD